MPNIGDIVYGREVGITPKNDGHKCIWHACVECGKERWVLLRGGQPQSQRCKECRNKYLLRVRKVSHGKDHHHWNGGRNVMTNGYVEVWLDPSSLFYPMAGKDGYIYEHRLVVAQHLGRCLESEEEVHHLNRNKHDNRIENLELLSKSEHLQRHWEDVNRLMQEISKLETENQRLRGLLHEYETKTT